MQTPKYIVLIVVCAIVSISLLGLLGTFYLILNKHEATAIALFTSQWAPALGALLAILVNTRSTTVESPSKEVTTTEVTNNKSVD